ncbi:MAG: DUF502 domain-containing protein [Pseudomonadota bacterium]
MKRLFRAFFAGFLALLPIALTIYGSLLLIDFVAQYVDPNSAFGRFLIGLGLTVDANSPVPWAIGFGILFLMIAAFGLVVESRIGPWITGLFEAPFRSIPVVGSIFDVVKRMTSVMDTSGSDDLKNMSPVWCFFGGDKTGAAVFGLLPTKDTVKLGSDEYLGVLLPTAPVPIGGALIYVPARWVEPADGAVDHLMSVYVSMGVQPPNGIKAMDAKPAQIAAADPAAGRAETPPQSG